MVSDQAISPAETGIRAGLKLAALKLCISVTLLVLLLGLGETAGWTYMRLHPPPQPYAELPLPPDYLREIQDTTRQQYQPYTEWRRTPHRGRYITVNAAGVRRTLHSYCDDTSNPVIWMFGDSVLWGTGAADGETIPSRVAELYDRAGERVCVVNYGEAGWVSTQELIELLLQLKRAARKPDIVLFYDGTDEVLMPWKGAPLDRHQAFERFQQMLVEWQDSKKANLGFVSRTNTARAIKLISQDAAAWMHERQHRGVDPDGSLQEAGVVAQAVVDNYVKNIRIVNVLAEAYGFRACFFWYPATIAGHKPLTPEENVTETQKSAPNYEAMRATYALTERVDEPGFHYLGHIFDARPERLFLDVTHMTPAGYELSAQSVFEILRSRQGAGQR